MKALKFSIFLFFFFLGSAQAFNQGARFPSSDEANENKNLQKDIKDKLKQAEKTLTEEGTKARKKIPNQTIEEIDKAFEKVREKLQKEYLVLKGGVSSGLLRIDARENTSDQHTSWGLNTHFGYHWYKWELTASSYISFGDVEDLTFKASGDHISGEGSLRFVSISPNIRYYTDWWPLEGWRFYWGLGPIWSLKTVKFDNFQTSGSFNNQRKLTYESRGGILIAGIEEFLPIKELHPVYLEMAGAFTISRKISIVDISNTTETNILSEERADGDIQNYTFLISMGITLF